VDLQRGKDHSFCAACRGKGEQRSLSCAKEKRKARVYGGEGENMMFDSIGESDERMGRLSEGGRVLPGRI